MTQRDGQLVQVDPRSERVAVGVEKSRIASELKTLESELRQQTHRHRVRKAFKETSLQTQLEQLQRNLEPATHPRGPLFFTEETTRSGHR
jgi:negative regulator of genetic competence, sporulation and motility